MKCRPRIASITKQFKHILKNPSLIYKANANTHGNLLQRKNTNMCSIKTTIEYTNYKKNTHLCTHGNQQKNEPLQLISI